jgi:hypothetical protein
MFFALRGQIRGTLPCSSRSLLAIVVAGAVPSVVMLINMIRLIMMCYISHVSGFQPPQPLTAISHYRPSPLKGNIYDDWAQDLLSTTQSPYTYDELQLAYCDEEAIEQCLEEFMESDYGKTMFGRHDLPASVG